MNYLLLLVVFMVSMISYGSDNFDQKKERQKILSLMNNLPKQDLKIQNGELAGAKQKEFINFFEKEIWPVWVKMTGLSIKTRLLSVARDRALYESDKEKEAWIKEQEGLEKELSAMSIDSKWKANVKKFSDLSKGLKGDLAEEARRSWKIMNLSQFSEKEKPLLDRQIEISTKISDISNTSPFVMDYANQEKIITETIRDWFAKKITFENAWKRVEEATSKGKMALAEDVGKKGEKLFVELAEIRSKLAKTKGFSNWAEYALAVQAFNYDKQFQTPKGLISFIKKILTRTKGAYKEFIESQFKAIAGQGIDQLRRSQVPLLQLEENTQVRDYFQKENIGAVWKKTMQESGFKDSAFEHISLDEYPRPGKMSHAYMENASSYEPKILTVNAKSLAVEAQSKDPSAWNPAEIFIVENYRDDDIDFYETSFHEGGHALNFTFEEDLLGNGQAYGYTETHSMFMERFFIDKDFIMATGKTKDGKPIPADLAQKFIKNKKINYLVTFRDIASKALFDIELWNVDFTKSKESYVNRARRLFMEISDDTYLAKTYGTNSVDPSYQAFRTSHFYSGDVRYFGYLLADMAASMTYETLLNKLEKATGRRTLYKQPKLADLLIDGYYRKGFAKPFPKSIEAFTGKKYSSDVIVKVLVKNFKEAMAPNGK